MEPVDVLEEEEIPEKISRLSTLYDNVRKSHALYQLGLDEEGQEITKKKHCHCFPTPSCATRVPQVDRRLFGTNHSPSSIIVESARRSTRPSRGMQMHSVKARKDKFSQKYSQLVNNKTYKIISVFLSMFALFLRDIDYAMFPQHADFWTLDVVLSVVFFWLFLELILYSLTHSNYCFTFFFWLDLVGTASILIDIPWIMVGVGLGNNIFLIVKGGRMGRAARGAGSVRLLKLMKMIRMVKLFRIIQLFRKKKAPSTLADSNINALISGQDDKEVSDEDS
eukprot:1005745_1